ncbi:MAG TPA: sensor domain-containing diguanylate cyclase [Alphaproteobacteria bacterium]
MIRAFRLLRETAKAPVAGPGAPAGGRPEAAPQTDDSFDRSLQAALIESRQRYKDLVDIAGDFAWETDAAGVFVFVSPRGALGYRAADLIGRRAAELLEDAEDAAAFAAREPLENLQLWLRRADGAPACLRLSAVPVADAAGLWKGARGICRDVTAARTRDAALARAGLRERLLGHILRAVRDTVEPAEMLAAAATATGRALGASTCLVLRADGAESFRPAARFGEDQDVAEERLAEAAAAETPLAVGPWLVAATRYHHGVNGIVALCAVEGRAWSVDDRALLGGVADHLGIAIAQIEDHERLRELSRTDGLTGLLNRRTFYEEVERRWRRISQGGAANASGGALVYCDLDNFKLVNDHAGHGAGDDALRHVARILRELTRGQDLLSRLGGDEFALWLEGADRAGAESKAAAILQAVRALAHLSGDAARPFAVSLGIALAEPGGEETLTAFFARADGAMYAAKQAGKGQVAFAPFVPEADA